MRLLRRRMLTIVATLVVRAGMGMGMGMGMGWEDGAGMGMGCCNRNTANHARLLIIGGIPSRNCWFPTLQALFDTERGAALLTLLQQLATPVMSVQALLARCSDAAKVVAAGHPTPDLAKLSQLRVRTAADSIAANLITAEVAINGAMMPAIMYRRATAAGTLPRAGPVSGKWSYRCYISFN